MIDEVSKLEERGPERATTRDDLHRLDWRGVQPLGAQGAVVLFEFFEGRIEGAERVAEKTMLARRYCSGAGRAAYVMRVLVVGDENRTTRKIVGAFRVRQRDSCRRRG